MAVTVTTTRWGRTEVDVVIPFLMWGKGVVSGCGIESAVTTLSVAPTLARLLGVSAPTTWEGGVVDEAIDGDPARADTLGVQ